MENKNQYQALLRGKVAAAIAQARSAADVTHKGVKGAVLEILLSKLFRPLLPADIGVGTGQIIDAFGNAPSPQIDIVIYNKEILPPVLIDENVGIFPIESVLYTIEVKTTLNAKELKSANDSAKKIITTFKYLPGKLDEKGKRVNHSISKPRAVLFALNSNLKEGGLTEAERYIKSYQPDKPYLSAICVAGREYCYEDRDCWVSMKTPEDHDETLNLLAGITNTYREVSLSRGYPQLGYYIASDRGGYALTPSTNLPKLTVICEQCGNQDEIICTFDQDDFKIINGTISNDTLCECGGKLTSAKGNYVIKGGRLREIAPLGPMEFKF
ncbi:Uncharacterised protein [Enterobacter hormaechei]|uniref:DUF6602 domain-containing protein n=5 Tax=Gammaproteobacteria TaxID=1236 RepID=A0AAE4J7W8_9ENTR|nr:MULTISPECIES: DUF6602 domain-containing protein [Enterobacter]CAE7337934.1 hypothetical protein AI2656V1_3378 [Enterobacter cloacae]VAL44550.1 Uncharacterised protein [Enterobacter kobei]DAF03582.1 MAG TPA: E protein [Caudoviricetes sp.]AWV75091.1 hypothetical protein DN066_06635 [Enterobacter hormaechei subsp. xiangfangensis]EHF5038195.1 hypothetical protein [Enterobacter hormaechei]